MKYLRFNQRGFEHVSVIVLVVVLGVVGFGGYYVMHANRDKTPVSQSSQVTAPATIQSKADLQQAGKALDADQNDNSLNESQLDADLNSVL